MMRRSFLASLVKRPLLYMPFRSLPLRRSASCTVEAAHRPPVHGRSLARIFRSLRSSGAPRAILERIGPFHEDASDF
jgi:hypothetical protein